MCKFANMSNGNSKALESGMRSEQSQNGLMTTKKVVEDYDLTLDGDLGTNGRPRFREEIKLPPQYDTIDLNDPNDPVLF